MKSKYQLQVVDEEFVRKYQFLELYEDISARDVRDARYVVLSTRDGNKLKTDVTYYTDRRRSKYTSTEGNPEGREWVYVLSHPQEPDLLKIGYTSKDPKIRIKELNSQTGVAGEYKLVYLYKTVNGQALEREIHNFLKEKRIHPRKEHFELTRDQAVQVIKEIGILYG